MMSSLLIDMGNSSTKWALKRHDHLQIGKKIVPVDGNYDYDEAWKFIEPPARILASNVLGEGAGQALQQWIQAHWPVSAEFVRSCARGYGVENGYLQPEQLGADRWIGLIAARAEFKEAVCIVDCGTAITVDVLDAAGRHQGGVICPGVRLMQDAVIRGARMLSWDGVARGPLLAHGTGAGIYSGSVNAAAGMVEKVLTESERAMGSRVRLLVTGGGAEAVMERLCVDYTFVPDLVLKGLAVIDSGAMKLSND
jgi:type III pantothenate kinase